MVGSQAERMGIWEVIADIAGWVAVGALLVVLAWAANERGRIHHVAALQRGVRKDAASLLASRAIGASARRAVAAWVS